MPPAVAWFVSSHGFGHAARASAVMAELARVWPGVRFEIYTEAPEWFFLESLAGRPVATIRYHRSATDVGMVQLDPFAEDVEATLERLAGFLPLEGKRVAEPAAEVTALGCRLVMCDISPLGIAVARAAGLPSVLVENFTWDWIYRGYAADCPALEPAIEQLAATFAQADVHIQTEPVCVPVARARLTVGPVSRAIRWPRDRVRGRLGIPRGAPLVLVTMGGVPWDHRHLDRLGALGSVHFAVPGAGRPVSTPDNVHLLPHGSALHHPDLVAASDAVVGKLGYSTLAEVHRAGVAFGFVPRPRFPESAVLAAFVAETMSGLALDRQELADGSWTDRVPELLALARRPPGRADGAAAIARCVASLVEG